MFFKARIVGRRGLGGRQPSSKLQEEVWPTFNLRSLAGPSRLSVRSALLNRLLLGSRLKVLDRPCMDVRKSAKICADISAVMFRLGVPVRCHLDM